MANPGERIMRASCTEDSVFVELADGRTVSAPLAWYPRLLHATPQQRSNCQIAGAGYGIHWPEIDEVQRRRPASRRPSPTRFGQGQLIG